MTDEQFRNPIDVIPPAMRPRVVLRYGNANELLVSGLLDGGGDLAQHPAVIDSPYGQGHVVLFSNNPFWRAETKGSYFLVFNAILNFDHLDAGEKASRPVAHGIRLRREWRRGRRVPRTSWRAVPARRRTTFDIIGALGEFV